jgi:hypothetical protein
MFPHVQVKLLDKMMHEMPKQSGQQVVLLSQVLAAEVNIGYEEMLNTQVSMWGARARGGGGMLWCASRSLAGGRGSMLVFCSDRCWVQDMQWLYLMALVLLSCWQVLSLNGTKLINMAQLVQLVDSCTEPFLHFHLDYDQKVRAGWGRVGV